MATIKRYFTDKSTSYVVDPHTAVGLTAADVFAVSNAAGSTVQVVLSTAHPAKFSEAVTKALQEFATFDFDQDVLPEEFRGLLEKPRRVIDVERPDVELVKEVIVKVAEETKVLKGNASVPTASV